jgi:hypothetical protein
MSIESEMIEVLVKQSKDSSDRRWKRYFLSQVNNIVKETSPITSGQLLDRIAELKIPSVQGD